MKRASRRRSVDALTLPSLRDGPHPLPADAGEGIKPAQLPLPLPRFEAGEGWGEGFSNLLHHNRAGHMRMQAAVIGVGSWLGESKRVFVVGIESRRFEHHRIAIISRNGVNV